jgi:hypothetical protein
LFQKSNKVLNIFEKQSWLYDCRSIQSKKNIHSNRKFGSHCFCKIKNPNKNFLKLKCDWWSSYFDTTDEYCTHSMYITPKTISRRIQKTNTAPQLYGTLSTWVCKPKPISCQNQKLTQHISTTGKKVPPVHAMWLYLFLRLWFRPSVRAKREE